MTFQSTVSLQQGFGVVGELFSDGPRLARPYTIVSASAANNVFGRGFSVTSQGLANAGNTGGTQIFAGILVNPKGSASFGGSGGPLTPTLTLANNSQGELLTEGSIIVTFAGAVNIGDLVIYDNTTGVLATIAPGVNLPVGKSFAFAFVDRYTTSAAGLAVITLQPTLTIPVLA